MKLTVWQLYKKFKQRLIEALGTVESAMSCYNNIPKKPIGEVDIDKPILMDEQLPPLLY